MNRRSTPKVRDGKVQKKNRHSLSPDYYVEDPPELVFHRMRPGPGYRHVLTKQDVWAFMEIIPEWQQLRRGLRAVVLVPDDRETFGRYNEAGIIKLCAWRSDLVVEMGSEIPRKKNWLIAQLGVETYLVGKMFECRFTEPQARAFLLLGTFLHELGHHVDRMSTRSKRKAANGEPFAERFEAEWQRKLWDRYCRMFGL